MIRFVGFALLGAVLSACVGWEDKIHLSAPFEGSVSF